ncbi:MAG: hypothetical protein HYW48_05850 [Deltaproteobacteria bacterium]|nr:hypothetical protein [Deltaproteobacteria bacterium]
MNTLFLSKYALLSKPRDAMEEHCKHGKRDLWFSCPVEWQWRIDKKWRSICATPRSRWSFPPRYYRLVMQCEWGSRPLALLRSEWEFFY